MIFSSAGPANVTTLLLVLVLSLLSVLWPLYAGYPASHDNDKYQWRQPAAIADSVPESIATKKWTFDFELVEQRLRQIRLNKDGALILDASLAKDLEYAISELPSNLNKEALQRLELLIAKGLPGSAGTELANMFTKFYVYLQASTLRNLSTDINLTQPEHHFHQRLKHQERIFGKKVAHQLFGHQNALQQYLYARRHINEDPSLNQAQKQRKLSLLQRRFKANEG